MGKYMRGIVILAICFIAAGVAYGYTIPQQESGAKFFYVFGPEGNPYYGADDVDHTQVVYITVPQEETADVIIKIFDPDTGGAIDDKYASGWETRVRFTVYGDNDKTLDRKEFGFSDEYDNNYYAFGPYPKEKGKKVGDNYWFKVVADALSGANQNLFNISISPESAESFSDKISFRLLPNKGDEMTFYPEIPAGTAFIVARNYDMDPDGATSNLYDRAMKRTYRVRASASAQWAETPIELGASEQSRRAEYIVTKETQRHGNAAIMVKDAAGNTLPIYFKRGIAPVIAPRPVILEAPVIEKAPDLECNKFTFDATGSYDPNNEKLSFLWDFGDGETSEEAVIAHVYSKGGQYTVTLTVKDTSGLTCDTSTTTQFVNVNTPPEPEFSGPGSVCVGDTILFDAGSTRDNTPESLTYMWNFGDGATAEGKTASKTYSKGGNYQVRLTVDDNSGTACNTAAVQKTVSVNGSPTADAGSDIDLCVDSNEGYRVTLNGSRSSDPDGDKLSYTWDFGDGETASGAVVTHAYDRGGEYTARLTVDDEKGSQCSVSTDTLRIKLNTPPVADAGPNLVCCTDEESIFDGSGSNDADGDTLTYKWDFGDGSTGEGVRTTHVYKKGGTYKVTLYVNDNSGASCSSAASSFMASVNDRPVAVMKIR